MLCVKQLFSLLWVHRIWEEVKCRKSQLYFNLHRNAFERVNERKRTRSTKNFVIFILSFCSFFFSSLHSLSNCGREMLVSLCVCMWVFFFIFVYDFFSLCDFNIILLLIFASFAVCCHYSFLFSIKNCYVIVHWCTYIT